MKTIIFLTLAALGLSACDSYGSYAAKGEMATAQVVTQV